MIGDVDCMRNQHQDFMPLSSQSLSAKLRCYNFVSVKVVFLFQEFQFARCLTASRGKI